MKFQRYGVEMERLKARHLEMVRQWRNSDLVRLRMHFQGIIDEVSQQTWFSGINNERNWYFVAYSNEVPFGVFHIKNIDVHTRVGEAGAFVGDERFLRDAYAARAILALMDFGFLELCLDALEAKYHPSFKEIKTLNEQLGYEMIADEADGFIRARVSRERYLEKTGRLRSIHHTTSHTS